MLGDGSTNVVAAVSFIVWVPLTSAFDGGGSRLKIFHYSRPESMKACMAICSFSYSNLRIEQPSQLPTRTLPNQPATPSRSTPSLMYIISNSRHLDSSLICSIYPSRFPPSLIHTILIHTNSIQLHRLGYMVQLSRTSVGNYVLGGVISSF